jgi:hypothetical protein
MDIIAAIDHATGCQQCGGPLDGSPSDDFCDQDCQAAWSAARTVPLVGYREPWDLLSGYDATPQRWVVGTVEEFTGPVERFRPLPLAGGQVYMADAGTPFEYLPGGGWSPLGVADGEVLVTSTTPDGSSPLRDLTEAARRFDMATSVVSFEVAEVNWDLMRRYFGLDEPEKPREVDGPTDPRERALWLRRNRNTGPTRQQRPPRAINARRSR